MQQQEISRVRDSISSRCGKRVVIQLDRGRNKIDVQRGTLKDAYPSVFTILVEDERDGGPPQLLSFSYTDIITKNIRMILC